MRRGSLLFRATADQTADEIAGQQGKEVTSSDVRKRPDMLEKTRCEKKIDTIGIQIYTKLPTRMLLRARILFIGQNVEEGRNCELEL